MRWIKASERLPKEGVELNLRYKGKPKFGYYSNCVFNAANTHDIWAVEYIEWLDDSPPASAVEEAEKLYPEPPGKSREQPYYDYQIVDIQRDAHIRCAGMYTDTIDKLKAENADLKKKLAQCAEDYNQLYDQAKSWKEESGK